MKCPKFLTKIDKKKKKNSIKTTPYYTYGRNTVDFITTSLTLENLKPVILIKD